MKHSHFEGKSTVEHLKEARLKGALATEETHGSELSGFFFSFCDSWKEGTLFFFSIFLIFFMFQIHINLTILFCFAISFSLWKLGRSALLGFSRLERLHRLIKQEKWEIEHHRDEEKKELIEMYQAKGFSGKLLDEIIEFIMTDDNRLLQVMLEDELGLNLESYEHPLKQAFGAFFGAIIATVTMIVTCEFISIYVGLGWLFISMIVCSYFSSKKQGNDGLYAGVWNMAICALSVGSLYFLLQIFKG